MSSACGDVVEDRFVGVVLGGQHSIGRRVFNRYDEVGVLGGVILLGVREDVGTVRGGTEEDSRIGVCCMEFLDLGQEGGGCL